MNISLELTETHQSNMMKVVEELADIKLQVQKLEQYLPRTILASSEVVHDIATLKEIMRELNRTMIEENKISSRVLSYLNITLPCGKMCPLSSMKTHHAHIKLVNLENTSWIFNSQSIITIVSRKSKKPIHLFNLTE